MSYRIHISGTASDDIQQVLDYIEFQLMNPTAADALLAEVEKSIALLSDFPASNPMIQDPILCSWQLRFITIRNYLAFYVIDDDIQTVYIVRFLYGKRNWIPILKQGFSLH